LLTACEQDQGGETGTATSLQCAASVWIFIKTEEKFRAATFNSLDGKTE